MLFLANPSTGRSLIIAKNRTGHWCSGKIVEKGGEGRSSSSHASDTDRVADLCDLTRGQDTFTSSEVVLEGNRRVSMVEPGSGNEWQFSQI